jgi:hypothetical protein
MKQLLITLRTQKSIMFKNYKIAIDIDEATATRIIDTIFPLVDFDYLEEMARDRASKAEIIEILIQCIYNLGLLGLSSDGCVSDVCYDKSNSRLKKVRADIWLYLVSIGLVNMGVGNKERKILNRYRASRKFRRLFGYI